MTSTRKTYPQVEWDDYYGEYQHTDHPTHKVVPIDAIVIERGDLPEVFADGKTLTADTLGVYGNVDPDNLERMALRYLAIAEYLRANPPVDEAHVEALADRLCADAGHSHEGRPECSAKAQARRLVARGVRVETGAQK